MGSAITADKLYAELVHSPRLRLLVTAAEDLLTAEAAARERFREALPDNEKAEFINGEVVAAMPARFQHGQVVRLLLRILDSFVRLRGLGVVGVEKMMIALTRNDYEPDLCFWRRETADSFTPEQWRFPAPDLVVEVLSESTADRDRGVKLEDYAAHGVAEYWIVDPDARRLEQYLLAEGGFRLREEAADGLLTASAIPGLSFPVAAAFDEDLNWEVVRRMLLSYGDSQG